jgi:integrase
MRNVSSRASFITNSLDVNERLSFIQAHCGFTTPRMIIDHDYRHVPAEDDGARMKEAWHSTRKVPDLENAKN